MKKMVALVLALTLACGAHAQRVFNGNTGAGGPSARCYEYNGGAPSPLPLSSTSTGQWYVGAASCAEGALVATGPTKAFTSGYCQAGAITTTYAPGSTVTVQLRAWKGASTWDAAQTTAGARIGKSSLIQVSGLVTGTAVPPTVSITGFTIGPDDPPYHPPIDGPEPSTITLSILGLSLLFLRRRK